MNIPGTLPRTYNDAVRRPRVPAMNGGVLKHAILLIVGLVVAYPFYFMLSSSVKPFFEAIQVPPTILPREIHLENYAEAWSKAPWPRYFANTVLVAGLVSDGRVQPLDDCPEVESISFALCSLPKHLASQNVSSYRDELIVNLTFDGAKLAPELAECLASDLEGLLVEAASREARMAF